MTIRAQLPVVALSLLLLIGCEDPSYDRLSDAGVQDVIISIDADQRILLDGEVVILEDLERRIREKLGDDKAEVVITVAPQTPMGFVSDVQQQLPASRIVSIRYPEPRG